MLHSRSMIFIGLIAVGLVLLTGCQDADSKAQKMLSQGQYQQVIDQFPDTQFALRARALLADKLFEEGKYDEIINSYSDTPAAYRAQQASAQRLFDAGKYQELIDKFPHSTLAAQSMQVLSDSLYTAGALDELIEKYPESPKAKLVLEERAKALFEKSKKMNRQDRMDALNEISTKYRGTSIYKEAATDLQTLRNAKP